MNERTPHQVAMDLIIDEGYRPIELIEGVIQFMENHYDGMPFDSAKQHAQAFQAIEKLRKANRKMDKIEHEYIGQKAFYN